MYNLQTKLVKFKDYETYIIVRTGLSMNENTKKPQAEAMLNPLDVSEIRCII